MRDVVIFVGVDFGILLSLLLLIQQPIWCCPHLIPTLTNLAQKLFVLSATTFLDLPLSTY